MLKRKRNKKWLVIGISFCVVLWGYLVIQKNSAYPQAERIQCELNERLEMNQLQLCVVKSRWATEDEIEASMAADGDMMASLGARKQRLVTLQIKNLAKVESVVEVYSYMLEMPGYSNGIIMEAFEYYNPGESLKQTLLYNEMVELILPFTIYEKTCTPEFWETLEEKEMWLDVSLYPIKRQIKIGG